MKVFIFDVVFFYFFGLFSLTPLAAAAAAAHIVNSNSFTYDFPYVHSFCKYSRSGQH